MAALHMKQTLLTLCCSNGEIHWSRLSLTILQGRTLAASISWLLQMATWL